MSSTVFNTGDLVKVTPTRSKIHTRNMMYTISAVNFRASEIASDRMHVTLFFFDSHRGFVEDAAVLDPKDGGSFTNVRDQEKVTTAQLREAVGDFVTCEDVMALGKLSFQRAEWDGALGHFDRVSLLCKSSAVLTNAPVYKNLSLGELGRTNNRLGRYQRVKKLLEEAERGLHSSKEQDELCGELDAVNDYVNNAKETDV